MTEEGFNETTDLFESTEEKKNLQRKEFMKSTLIGLSVAVVSVIAIAILVAISLSLSGAFGNLTINCVNACQYAIVESIPNQIDLVSPPGVRSTFEVLEELISSAQTSIKISAFYWTLNNTAYNGNYYFKFIFSWW